MQWSACWYMGILGRTPSDGVRLGQPCRVVEFGMYLDGGTIGGILVDAWQRRVPFSFGGPMSETFVDSEGEHTSGESYFAAHVGAKHWRDNHSVRLAQGSKGEEELLRSLMGWVDSVVPSDKQEGLLWALRADSLAVVAKGISVDSLSRNERRALKVLGSVKALQRSNEGAASGK